MDNINNNYFKPKIPHIFFVKDISVKIKRKKWREEEIKRRKGIFTLHNA
jgi:hypothetical protein